MQSLRKFGPMVLALVAICALPAYAQVQRPAAGGWEYVVIIEGAGGYNGAQQLNIRGQAGWDLVTVSCRTLPSGAPGDCYFYMKRPRP